MRHQSPAFIHRISGTGSPVLPRYGFSFMLCALLSVFCLLPLPALAAGLPSIGSDRPDKVTSEQEFRLGRAWLRQYRARSPVIYDPLLQHYLEQLVQTLAVEADLYERRLNLVATRAKTINAFAVPGGVMGVHSALLTRARDEDMVASVLAHELAHLSQRHYARRKDSSESQSLPLLTAMLTGLVLSANGHSQAGVAAIAGSQAAVIQNQLRFSRQHEQEADAIGFQVLNDAGFDGRGMARMFELLQEQARTSGGNAPEFLLTHPLTESRIAFAKEREDSKTDDSFYSNLGFQLIRVRALFFQHSHEERPAALEGLMRSVPHSLREPVQLYADILDALSRNQIRQARDKAAELALQPDHLYFRLLGAQVRAASGDSAEAIRLLEQQQRQNPDHFAVQATLAGTYLKSGQHARAQAAFSALSRQRPEDPWVWQQLAQAATANKALLTVYRANAEYHQLTGDIPQGVAELRLALDYATDDPIESARLEHRISELETLFKELDF